MAVSFGVLLLPFLHWPSAWLIRRRYGAVIGLKGRSLAAYRAVRLIAGLTVVLIAAWATAIIAILGSPDLAAGGADAILWVLQLASAAIFVGAAGLALWNGWIVLKDRRGWRSMLWSLLIILSTLVFLYVAIRFGLLAMTAEF